MRAFLIMLAATLCTSTANAQCPQNAEQTLYNMLNAVKANQYNDTQKVFNLATDSLNKCPDRDVVQGQAAELLMMVGSAVSKPSDKFIVYSKAYEAVINNGKTNDAKKIRPVVVVKKPDGHSKPLYYYAKTTGLLNYLIPELAALSQQNHVHSIFKDSYTSGQACPHKSERRVLAEAGALYRWAGQNGKKLLPAVHRVNGLYVTCSDYRTGLSYYLAIMNSYQANDSAASHQWDKAITHIKNAQKYKAEYLPHDKDYQTLQANRLPTKLNTKLANYQTKLNQSKEK